MNVIVNATEINTALLQLPKETETLIKASMAENTRKAYQQALNDLTNWLSGRTLSDMLLANYITSLHETGKSPATIGQVVAAVKWQLKHQSQETLNLPITQATLAGIRRAGKDRGRGQVNGLIWQDVERVCIYAETEGTLAGLRDAAMIRLMSDCLLRISEVVAVDVSDLKERTLTLQTSKTDQEGTGESLYVCDATRNVLKRYWERAGITRGALFRHIRRGDHIQSQRLTPHSARRIIQKRCKTRVWKASSLGILSESVLWSLSRKPEQLLLICKLRGDGNPHRCRHTTPKQNAAQSHDFRNACRYPYKSRYRDSRRDGCRDRQRCFCRRYAIPEKDSPHERTGLDRYRNTEKQSRYSTFYR